MTDEQVALACAALAGTPVALGKEVGASFDSAAFVLQLGQGYFTGVVALEQGLQTHIRRFQYGTALSTEPLPARLRATRFTQIVWQEQLLPEVGASQTAAAPPLPQFVKPFGQAQPAVPPPVVQAAVPDSGAHPAPDPAPDLFDRPGAAPPESAQVQRAPGERSSEVPETYVGSTFALATPAVSAQTPSALMSAQVAPVQAAPVQAVQVQASPPYAEPTRATPPATAQPSASVLAADADAWERLKAILEQNLGRRSPRVYQLMRTELGAFSGAELMSRLAWQVERIAGAAAARNFRNGR